MAFIKQSVLPHSYCIQYVPGTRPSADLDAMSKLNKAGILDISLIGIFTAQKHLEDLLCKLDCMCKDTDILPADVNVKWRGPFDTYVAYLVNEFIIVEPISKPWSYVVNSGVPGKKTMY